jgi:hypothetical protein
MIELLASYNDTVAKFVFENSPKFANYTSHIIQNKILQVKCKIKFMKILGTLNFAVLLIRRKMSLRENK